MSAIHVFTMALTLLLAFAPLASAVQSIGTVIALEGTALDTAADGTKRDLSLKSPVYLNDTITTPEKSKLQIMFLDDSVISQGESSEMTIDEYIYSPAKKEDNAASVKMARGVFRTVAGKITELNPNRFKVKTRMATIGIRGCELGFRLGAMQEDVYVLYLPEGKEIVIEKEAFVDEGLNLEELRNSMTIADSGVVVAIRRGMALQADEISAGEALQVFQDAARISRSDDDDGSPGDATQEMVEEAEEIEDLVQLDRSIQDILDNLPPVPSGPNSDGAPSTSVPTTAPPSMVGGHPTDNDWEWGLWDDGTVVYYGNRYISADFIPAADFAAIVAGAGLSLTLEGPPNGTSAAGAILTDLTDGSTVQVNGAFSAFNVTMPGASAQPTWSSQMSLTTPGPFPSGDLLQMTANGVIDNNGNMSLSAISAYAMTVNDRNYVPGDILTQSMDGRLVQPAGGIPVITGTVGEFHMTHVDATVDGAFGADLQ